MKSKRGLTKQPKRGFAVLDREKATKAAHVAVRTLRRILKDARADLSVHRYDCDRLDNALDRVEAELNELLPPPQAPPKPRLLLGDDPEDDSVPGGNEDES